MLEAFARPPLSLRQLSADLGPAYLVNGLGHCAACHTARNALGGPEGVALAGGLIPKQNWYAPSLISASEGGVGTAR